MGDPIREAIARLIAVLIVLLTLLMIMINYTKAGAAPLDASPIAGCVPGHVYRGTFPGAGSPGSLGLCGSVVDVRQVVRVYSDHTERYTHRVISKTYVFGADDGVVSEPCFTFNSSRPNMVAVSPLCKVRTTVYHYSLGGTK